MKNNADLLFKYFRKLFFPAGLIIIFWEAATRISAVDHWILPTPIATFGALYNSRYLLLKHAITTISEAGVGLILAIGLAWIIASIMFYSPQIKRALYPLLIISQTIPFVAIAPVLVIWFGFGILPKVIIVALVCFFPITVSLVTGFSTVDSSQIRLMQVMKADRWQIFRFVIAPSSLPLFFSGLRISGSYALLTAVIAEWLGATDGLGVFMIRASKSYRTDQLFASVIVVSVISLAVVAFIDKIHAFLVSPEAVKN